MNTRRDLLWSLRVYFLFVIEFVDFVYRPLENKQRVGYGQRSAYINVAGKAKSRFKHNLAHRVLKHKQRICHVDGSVSVGVAGSEIPLGKTAV